MTRPESLRPAIALSFLSAMLLWMGSGMAADTAERDQSAEAEHPLLRCERLHWLKNCDSLNEQATKHPSAPLRLVDPKGLEFHFAPGTPSVIIEHVLDPSKASAARVIDYQNAVLERNLLAARFAQEVMMERGHRDQYALHMAMNPPQVVDPGMRAIAPPKTQQAAPMARRAQVSRVRAWLFYSASCPACSLQIAEVKRLLRLYPELDITLLQMDDDPAFLQRLRDVDGLKAGAIPQGQLANYQQRVRLTPTIWVENKRSKETWQLEGVTTVESIERAILEASE